MNKFFIFSLLISLTFLTGCSSIKISQDSNDYSLYYSFLDNMKGIEIYCWTQESDWYTGILPGTNRIKITDEIEWLQQNLPCPILKMKEILKSYDEASRDNAFVCVVSSPPKSEELRQGTQAIYDNYNTYKWLYNQLGLDFNY